MTILNLDSPRGPRSGKSLKLALVAGALAAVVAVASTLAANININSGPVEFGQGVAQTAACSGDDEITLTPQSTFVNSATDPNFFFTSLSVSGIPDSCIDTNFKFSAYSETGTALSLTECNNDGGFAPVVHFTGDEDTDQTEQSSEEMYTDVYDATETGFSLSWHRGEGCESSVLASQVYKVTVETSVGDAVVPDIGEYVADYNLGSTNFNSTPIFSIDANSVSPGDHLWTDTNTASTLNLTANADFSSSANSYADFANVQATADLGSSITTMDRVTVELWVNFRDSGTRFSASPFSFDTTDDREDIAGCGYSLSFNDGYLGINTCNSDTLGFLATNLNDAWHHIIWIASTGDRYTQKIYVDGQLKLLTRYDSGENPDLQENPRPNIGSGIIGVNTWDPLNALKIGAINVYAGEMPLGTISVQNMYFRNRLT